MRVAAGGEERVEVFGTDYPTPRGRQARATSTSKPWRARLLALEGAESGTHKIYNLGNGSGCSVGEAVEAVRRIAGRRVEIAKAPRRAGDPVVIVASSEK